ncbi:hypothetical protein AFNJKBDN_CDS0011 [Halorubrum virus V_ICIS4]|nr:hypothetical protein AFNJKBDN_CDS0011 [Halorubrum virus V_ICIS4]
MSAMSEPASMLIGLALCYLVYVALDRARPY